MAKNDKKDEEESHNHIKDSDIHERNLRRRELAKAMERQVGAVEAALDQLKSMVKDLQKDDEEAGAERDDASR